MFQRNIAPRDDWQQRLCQFGFDFFEVSSRHPYWVEDKYFQVSRAQIDHIDSVTETLHQMCLNAIQHVFDNNLLDRFGLPARHHEMLRQSWQQDKTYLYGRFDFAWDGKNSPKMLEYNAQTPTSLFEASIASWDWLKANVANGELSKESDQFNSHDEQLIVQFNFLKMSKKPRNHILHFACYEDCTEDLRTVSYLAACAEEAGWEPVITDIRNIHLTMDYKFADHNKKPISNLFSLYPYEFALFDEYADYMANSGCVFIEPLWKVLLSSKALLPILWKLYPNHENLLECYYADDPKANQLNHKVVKPIYSREGANISITFDDETIEATEGHYGVEGYIAQQYAPLVKFDSGYSVIGSWMIGQTATGISFRESNNKITDDVARFVPHIILN
ncbi:glutathionylspermidine synthase family protein [Vibrio marisflavi]|uniref:Acid--amine ligase YgiC n=1 Tax=Vibrio marisflavi CECT 7928 TaxID=634439 RepID=A0ABM9A1E3_9VIBR|nr:glutathionylspermidine synthase family protein [Vibrio marisflavi]CAH0537421.1 Putative acid--amine ligase YgiC [Vibrio marisflavi CECT 7928]